MFAALADMTRLRILNLLGEGELCVCDLMAVLRAPQSKISRHLSYLRRSGLVSGRKEGLWMYYRIAPSQGPLTADVLQALRRLRRTNASYKKDLRALRKNRARQVVCCD